MRYNFFTPTILSLGAIILLLFIVIKTLLTIPFIAMDHYRHETARPETRDNLNGQEKLHYTVA